MNRDTENELIGRFLSDDDDGFMIVKIRAYSPDEVIEQALRVMDREIDMANGRPSNHHGSNPRRSK